MERLTEKFVCNLPDEVLEKLGIADVPKEDYEIKETYGATCKETCEEHECSDCPISKAINKLAAYEDAEEQGLLLRLPCKVGSTVYIISRGIVIPLKIDGIYVNENSIAMCGMNEQYYGYSKLTLYERKAPIEWFLTKEEAKQALKQTGEREDE